MPFFFSIFSATTHKGQRTTTLKQHSSQCLPCLLHSLLFRLRVQVHSIVLQGLSPLAMQHVTYHYMEKLCSMTASVHVRIDRAQMRLEAEVEELLFQVLDADCNI